MLIISIMKNKKEVHTSIHDMGMIPKIIMKDIIEKQKELSNLDKNIYIL